MTDIVSPALGLVGDADSPYAGRVVVRHFNGTSEAVYISSRGPSECEQLNAWFVDAGIDNRVSPHRYPVKAAKPDQADADQAAEPTETNSERVARRAKQRIRWSAKAIGADRMLTLTYRENQTDFVLAKAHLAKFVRMCRERWPSFKYVAVPEQQKRGAWHWHLALQGFVNIDAVRGFWWRSIGYRVKFSEGGKPVLLDASETPGNIDVATPRTRGQKRRTWQIDRLCAYLSKYMTKAVMGGLDHKASYSVTRGLTWRVERFVVRALTFPQVVTGFFNVLEAAGVQSRYLFQAEDRRTLWAACVPLSVPA